MAGKRKRSPKRKGTKPARGYSWKPFERGEPGPALKHGGSAGAERLEPRARELASQVFEENPQLDPKRYQAAVIRYCMALARIERVWRWLSEQSDEVFADLTEGQVHAVYERLERWENQAERAEDRLAIAPLTRARLGLDLQKAQANEEEAEANRQARDRLDARVAEIEGEDGDG